MKNILILFAFCLYSSLAAANPISSLGCAADPDVDPVMTARIDIINPLYVITWGPCFWESIAKTPDPATWDWSQADRMVNINFAKGRRIIWVAFINPSWVKGFSETQWRLAFVDYCRAVVKRYGNKIWALQAWNEPGPCNPDTQAWGYLPGVIDYDKTMRAFLIAMYRAVKPTLKGTNIKLAGPAYGGGFQYDSAKLLFNEGARGLLNVCVFHFYGGRVQHPDQPYPSLLHASIPPVQEQVRRWRDAAGNIPLIVTELGLYGQSATSGAHPNTGDIANNSGFSERQGIRDAILFALLMRAGGATAIMPHILPNSSGNPKDNSELAGYEFNDGIDPAKVRMKSKTSAFIDTLKLLENLTDAQIKELARLVLSL